MKSMDKISTGIAYGTSAGSAGYWFLQLLDRVTPSQWVDWPPESPDNQYHLNK